MAAMDAAMMAVQLQPQAHLQGQGLLRILPRKDPIIDLNDTVNLVCPAEEEEEEEEMGNE